MPTATETPEVHEQQLPNPVFDVSKYVEAAKAYRASEDAKTAVPSPQPLSATPEPPKPDAPAVAKVEPTPAPVGTQSPTTEDDFKEPAPNSPITRKDFAALAQSRKEFKAQAEKLRADQETLAARAKQLEEELTKTKASLPPNLEEIQKALADAKRHADENKLITEQLETIKLERSPRFQNWWQTETGKHIKVAQKHVPTEAREKIAKLVMEPASEERDAALSEIIDPLSSVAKRFVTGAMESIETLHIEREEALEKGSARWKQLQEHEKAESAKTQEETQQRLVSLQQKAVERAKAYDAFKPTGDATADAEIAQREAFVRACIAGKVEEDVLLNMPAISLDYLHLTQKVVPKLKEEIAKQSELIKQLQSGVPKAAEGKGGSPKATSEASKRGTSFQEEVMRLMKG
jgi:hypothetical protein